MISTFTIDCERTSSPSDLPSRTVAIVEDEAVASNEGGFGGGGGLLLPPVVVPRLSSVQRIPRAAAVGFLRHVFKLATISKRTSSMVEKLEANLRLRRDVSFDPLSPDLSADLGLSLGRGCRSCLTLSSGLFPGGGSPAGLGQVDNVHQRRALLSSLTRDPGGWVGGVTAAGGTSLMVAWHLAVLALAGLATRLSVVGGIT